MSRAWNMAHALRDDRGPIQTQRADYCERCGTLDQMTERRAARRNVYPVHAARMGLIVESMICRDCILAIGRKAHREVVVAKAQK